MMKNLRILFCIWIALAFMSIAKGQSFPPPGKMVDMGGYNMHLLTSGSYQNKGAIIFFHGAGDIALHWKLVLDKMGDRAFGVAIDQNGEGWSEHGFGNSIDQQVHDSFEALQKSGIEGPYLLVGHSLGGILAHKFASKYKEQTRGLILVDATHPDVVLKIYNQETSKMEWKRMRLNAKRKIPPIKTGDLKEPLEISSFQPKRDFGESLKGFSVEDQKMFNWIYNERPYTYVKGQSATYEAEVFQEMYENYGRYHLGDIPLTVITGGKKTLPEGDKNWSSEALRKHSMKLQESLLSISSNSKQIITKNSGHNIHLEEPEIIAQAIFEQLGSRN